MSLRDNQLSCQKALALSSRRDNHHPRRDRQNDHPDCRRLPIQIVALQALVKGRQSGKCRLSMSPFAGAFVIKFALAVNVRWRGRPGLDDQDRE